MCGVVGILRFDGAPVDEELLRTMAGRVRHRGPDGDGFRIWPGVGFGHVRLAVIDPAGSPQPMSSVNGPMHVTFNGEIFNYRDVRADLEKRGVRFATRGDTEVLLETCRLDGVAGLSKLDGQFAFAVYDERTGGVWLARDRLGILPLYWYTDASVFAFASEAKALLPIVGAAAIDDDAVEDYLTRRSVPAPRTLFRGIRKMAPGTALHVDATGRMRAEVFWALPAEPEGAPLDGPGAVEAVERALTDAVARRLVADVPVGAYLSGGVDSSLVVALMKQARHGSTVSTFSAGFDDPRYDDLPSARSVSRHLDTDHHEVKVSASDFLELWPRLTWHRDEPLAEPAEVAVYRLAQSARQSVKVLLSGDGCDELFAGYPKYRLEARLHPFETWWSLLGPGPLRMAERMLPASMDRARIGLRALATRGTAERVDTWFAPFTWYERRALRAGFGAPRDDGSWARSGGDHLRRMLYVDCKSWLPDNLLAGVDRMSMAAGVESRPPLLDHRLVELAFRVDSSLKIRGRGKWIVKEIARKHLPAAIVDRKKIGFRVPLDEWFRAGLRDFAHDLLLAQDSFVSSYFDRAAVARLLADHERGRRNEAMRLWTLVGLETWHRTFLRDPVAAAAPKLART